MSTDMEKMETNLEIIPDTGEKIQQHPEILPLLEQIVKVSAKASFAEDVEGEAL